MNTLNCILAAVVLILAGAFISPADSATVSSPWQDTITSQLPSGNLERL